MDMNRKENRRKIFTTCLLLVFFTAAFAKEPSEVKALDGIIPRVGASPEVALLGKFDYAPVSNYNGVPDISIPLYTLQENGIELPFVLRYNSSGIKVSEEATWVGLGWDLTVGGYITQIPVGQPDQDDNLKFSPGFDRLLQSAVTGIYGIRNEDGTLFRNCSPASADNFSTFWSANKYQYGQPDNYAYALPGTSGKFYIDPKTNTVKILGNEKEHVIIKGQNLTSTSNPYSSNWTITDLNGIQYVFNSTDKEITDTYPQPTYNNGQDLAFTSATWRVSSIAYPSGNKINFAYTNAKVITNSFSEYYFRPEYMIANSAPDFKKLDQRDESTAKYLNKVESNNQRIEFELSADRQDLSGGQRLNYIHIWDKLNNRKIKSYKFNYSYFNATNNNALEYKRLKLVSIDEIGYNGNTAETIGSYKFEYDETKPLSSKRSYATDIWGYYNGQTSNTGLIPKLDIDALDGLIGTNTLPQEVVNDFWNKGNANRGIDSVYVTSGVLTKITYPTGGYLKLQYQINDFTNCMVLTAGDINPGNSSNQQVNIFDIKYSNSSASRTSSDMLYPDSKGKLRLSNLAFTVTRLPNTASKLTGANFKNANVTLLRGSYYPNETIKKWEIPAADLQTFSNQIAQTGSGSYAFNLNFYEYQGNPNDRYWITVTLGDQMSVTSCSYPCEAIASFTCFARIPLQREVSYGGGLRIRSQEVYDENNQLTLKKTYAYTNADGKSSGKLMTLPRFYSFQKIVYKDEVSVNPSDPPLCDPDVRTSDQAYIFTISCNSHTPLSNDAQGALVGYDRVAVTEINTKNETNGQTVYYYNNQPSQVAAGLSGVPSIPYYNNGLEQKIEYYDSKQNLIKKSEFVYTSLQREESRGAFVWDNYVGPDKCAKCALGNRFAYPGRWYVCTYPIIGTLYKLTKRTDTDQLNGKSVVNEYVYEYNSYGQTKLESHRQLANSGKEDKQYVYPLDATDATANALRQKGLYSSILNEKTIRNSVTVDNKEFAYTTTSTGNVKVSAVKENINSAPYNLLDAVLYDARDNIKQYHKYTDPTVTIIWGYNYQYPIAEIKNAAFADVESTVKTVFSAASIDALSALAAPNETKLKDGSLQKALPNALVTTYTYKPSVGILTATAPNCTVTYYDYDSWGRLKETYLMDGSTKRTLQSYTYHYQNQ